ncbi:Diguanylate cyclase/phosphodiesterase domain 2 protein [Paucilactobacillus oligofermentans DSM 15707 = LMG 22743]|uniref:hypothetical protein n=1 Tax=Paucilactobacillus oligofermentans TaxID=293371 RepID=UPI00070ECEE8|nr:hypothetical protein [Paucilactobacillus oligofermentans]CUS25848.1 Diguanylate cyclase/phosphodiesterase domain 2 protein [Paucilactobacillus oligofermentans DSM 15707 = LMG 22743]
MLTYGEKEFVIGSLVLLVIFIVFAIVFVGFQRRVLARPVNLRYVIQTRTDWYQQNVGSECILQRKNENGQWENSDDESISLHQIMLLLQELSGQSIESQRAFIINLNYHQIMSSEFMYFVRDAINKIGTRELIIEYTPQGKINKMQVWRLKQKLYKARILGVTLSSNITKLTPKKVKAIKTLIPLTDIMKCSLSTVQHSHWFQTNVDQIVRELNRSNHQTRLILIGKDDQKNRHFIKQLNFEDSNLMMVTSLQTNKESVA